MNELWKLGLRSVFALGLSVMLLLGAGCNGDDDDDDNGGGTDTTPTAFSFTPQTSVPVSTATTSAPITVAGIDAAAPISVTGGSYSINNGAFTSSAGTVTNGQSVAVRHTSAAANSTVTRTTLTIGGVSAPFISITQPPAGADTTPVAFSFAPLTGAALNTALTSNAVTISGIDTPVPITITGGTYSINGGAFTSDAGVVSEGQTVALRQTSSNLNNTNTTTTVTIGALSRTFTTTTLTTGGTETTPNPFAFTNMTSVALSAVTTSAPITVSGITAPAPVSVSGGTYSIEGGAFTSAAGTVNNGQSVAVRHTSAATPGTGTTTTLNIGGITAPFTSTTGAVVDTTPNAFTFTNMTSVAVNTVTTSAPITVSGINAPAPISITGGTYSIEGGAFTSAAGTVANGESVAVRHTSAPLSGSLTTTTLTIGGVSGAFTSTTEGPNAFQLYQTKAVPGNPAQTCAACHRLGTLDTTGSVVAGQDGPDLADTDQMPLRYPNPGAAGHFGIVLSAEEIAALTALFQSQ